MSIVQLFNREDAMFENFDVLNKSYLSANLEAIFAYSLFSPTVIFLSAMGTALILWFGGTQLSAWGATYGTVIALILYTNQAFQPIRDIADKYTILQAAMAASERIFGLLDEVQEPPDVPNPVTLPKVLGEIEFKNVVFGYDPSNPVLERRLVQDQRRRERRHRGRDRRRQDLNHQYHVSLLRHPGGPDPARRRRHATDAQIRCPPPYRRGAAGSRPVLRDHHQQHPAPQRLRLPTSRFAGRPCSLMPIASSTSCPTATTREVRERGANFSAGQRQLLAFARAIAFDPEVLLVLDEATSSVDTETETLIQEALERLMKGRTSIIIAHRLFTIRHVDRIIVLHKGRVVEQGNHEELLARQGYYHRLYELQYEEQELAEVG